MISEKPLIDFYLFSTAAKKSNTFVSSFFQFSFWDFHLQTVIRFLQIILPHRWQVL